MHCAFLCAFLGMQKDKIAKPTVSRPTPNSFYYAKMYVASG